MIRVALVGATGYVGGAVATALGEQPDVALTPVGRADYEAAREAGPYDVLVNAAMPSRRFWARRHPHEDFAATVGLTSRLVHDWEWGKLVQVSTISARSRPDTVYGRHKATAEALVAFRENLVVRLGPMYGGALDKGVLIDLLHDRTVHVAAGTRYGFVPVGWVGGWIAANLDRRGIVEVTGSDAPTLGEVAGAIGSRSPFEGPLDHQEAEPPLEGAPPAREAIAWLAEARAGAVE